MGEAVVLNGSGSYTAGDDPVSGDCTAPPYCVAQASPVAWRAFRMAACVCHTGLELRTSGAQHTDSPSRVFLPRLGQSATDLEAAPDYKGSCCEGLRGDGSRRDEERLLLQALNVRWCAGAVERYEARQAAHFCMLKGPIEPTWHADPRQVRLLCSHVLTCSILACWTALVVFTRPDLVWWQPFKPWCSWPQRAVLTCEAPGCDVAWVAPRAHLARFGRQHHSDYPYGPSRM